MNKDCLIIKKDEYTKLLTENEELKRKVKEITTPNSIRVVVSKASYGGTHFIDLYEGNIDLSRNIYRQVRSILDKISEHSKEYVKESMKGTLQRTLHSQSTEHVELIESIERSIGMLRRRVLEQISRMPFRKRKTKKRIEDIFGFYFPGDAVSKDIMNKRQERRYEEYRN